MDAAPRYLSFAEIEAAVPDIRRSPTQRGLVAMIVRRPSSNQREVIERAELSVEQGLVGDRWKLGKANPAEQIALMSSRVIALLAQHRDRWPLAGDQFYVDLDLSAANVPPGTRLTIGSALLEVSTEPHLPCRKFRDRYGVDAVRFLGSELGKELQLRGVNATIVRGGEVRVGDVIEKTAVPPRPS